MNKINKFVRKHHREIAAGLYFAAHCVLRLGQSILETPSLPCQKRPTAKAPKRRRSQ